MGGIASHRAVALTPLAAWLGAEPDERTGALADAVEHLRGGVVVIGPPVAEDDDGRTPVELAQVAGLEGSKDAAVVGVVGGGHDAAPPGLGDGDANRRAREKLSRFPKVAHEDEAPSALEELLCGVRELEQEARGRADGVAHVTEEDELRAVTAATLSYEVERDAARAEGATQRSMRVDRAPAGMPGTDPRTAPEAFCEATDGVTHVLDLGVRQGREGGRLDAAMAALALEVRDARFVDPSHVRTNLVVRPLQLRGQGVGERLAAGTKSVDEKRAKPRKRLPSPPRPELRQEAMGLEAELKAAVGVDGPRDTRYGQQTVQLGAHREKRGERRRTGVPARRQLVEESAKGVELVRRESLAGQASPERPASRHEVAREEPVEHDVESDTVACALDDHGGDAVAHVRATLEANGVNDPQGVDGLGRRDLEPFASELPEELVEDADDGAWVG